MTGEVSCREIGAGDTPALVEILLSAFPERPRAVWKQAFARLEAHRRPPGYPQFGHMLTHRGRPVGLVLTCYSAVMDGAGAHVRCSLSSWCVLPEFRCYGAMLSARALMRREVSYLNITPHPDTFRLLAVQGYKRYCDGVFLSLPALAGRGARAKVVPYDGRPCDGLSPFENALLADHAGYGCIAVTCCEGGRQFPFVFATNRVCRAPSAYLSYCRSTESFVRFAGPLGRYLARRGHPMVMLDANGPVPGLVGKYYGGWPKFFKGPNAPQIGDLAYTERPLFGF